MKKSEKRTRPKELGDPSLQVPRTEAETAIHLLSELGIVAQNLKFKSNSQYVTIPLVRNPSRHDLDLIQISTPQATVTSDRFESRRKRPRTLEESLSRDIPSNLLRQLPRSFDIVGDIAILEFEPHMLTYERRVADAMLEVHSNIKAVFAKAGSVSGSERIRPLRHISGENRTDTVHREFGCSFKVDLSKVFFSPRLSTEHQRIAQQVGEGETVVDMFAGLGSFSILIAKSVKNVTLDAIDSNPEAVRLMQENVRLNRVLSKVHVHQGDARNVVESKLRQRATRIIMNHPSASSRFVDAACEGLQASGGIIHFYTFGKGEDSEEMARSEFEQALRKSNFKVSRFLGTRRVREVAPMKWQIGIDARVVPAS